jgi:hypothetical protein
LADGSFVQAAVTAVEHAMDLAVLLITIALVAATWGLHRLVVRLRDRL